MYLNSIAVMLPNWEEFVRYFQIQNIFFKMKITVELKS